MGEAAGSWRLPGHWMLWAGAAAVPVSMYMLRGKPRSSAPEEPTGFDHYLRQPVPSQQPTKEELRQATQFDTFLKVRPAEPNPTDFSTFLKNAPAAGGVAGGAAAAPAVVEEAIPLDRARVTVMYGTEYGFSKEIAEKLCAQLKETGAFW